MVRLTDPVSVAIETSDGAKVETDIRAILREFGLTGTREYTILHRGNNPHGNNGRRKNREDRLKLRSFYSDSLL